MLQARQSYGQFEQLLDNDSNLFINKLLTESTDAYANEYDLQKMADPFVSFCDEMPKIVTKCLFKGRISETALDSDVSMKFRNQRDEPPKNAQIARYSPNFEQNHQIIRFHQKFTEFGITRKA